MQSSKLRLLSYSLSGLLFAFISSSLPAAAQTTAPNEWTWVGGNGTPSNPYDGQSPYFRSGAMNWTDNNGNLWLFGGSDLHASIGSPSIMDFSDLWKFNPSTNVWTYINGGNGLNNSLGVYGTLRTPDAGNFPSSREYAASWTDSSGNLWLFGGAGALSSIQNDLWEYTPATNEWVWMGGSNAAGSNDFPGVYGTPRTPAAGNFPGGRGNAAAWTDGNGNFWLYGGSGYDASGNLGYLNDLWEFNPSINQWAWMGGNSTLPPGSDFEPAVYGTLGTPALANNPGSRTYASTWTDKNGNFWLFGGSAPGYTADMWKYDPVTNEWAWMSGSSATGQTAVYGTLGVSASANTPGSRWYAVSWTDKSGNFWLFGGETSFTTVNALPDDLWEYNPLTNEWAWMGGNSTIASNKFDTSSGYIYGWPGVYGAQGEPATGNNPGSSMGGTGWTDGSGNLWLFGGQGFNSGDDYDYLNDMWVYQPSTTPNFPTTAKPGFSVTAGTYTTAQTVTITDATPGAAIYYTTDGITTPTVNSTLYTGAITVSASETVQAIAIAVAINTLNSPVATATYTITPNFSIAASPGLFTVTAGQNGSTTITVTPLYGFNSAVSFSCSGLPAGASCNFSPTTVMPPGTTSTTLTVSTLSTTAELHSNGRPLLPGSMLAVALCCLGWRKRRRLQMLLLLAVSVVGLSLLNGCGGSSSAMSTPPPVSSTVTVSATSGSLTNTTTFTLTVN